MVIMMDSLRDSLRNALYYIFYQNFSMSNILLFPHLLQLLSFIHSF